MTRREGRAPTSVVLVVEVSVRAWPGPNAVDLACSLVEDVDDDWSVVVDYGVVLFLGFFLSHGSAFDDSWAGSVAAVR